MNYISFTATPYANVLNEAFEESLYPKDFICSLPESNEYFGAKAIFGSCSDEAFPGLNVIRTVSETEMNELKAIHKGTAFILPTEFKKSVCWFLCCAAVLRIRGHKKPISMLIHTTALQRSHFEEYEILKNWLLRERTTGEIISLCESVYNIEREAFTLEDLKNSYPSYGRINEINGEYPDFSVIKPEIELLLGHIENIMMADDRSCGYHKDTIHLCVDNCGANRHAEEGTYLRVVYPSSEKLSAMDKAPVFIVIGGNTLARGLTLEGLVCTYFAEKTKSFCKYYRIDLLNDFVKDEYIEEIEIIGHSCGIDFPYFEYLNRKYPTAKWIFNPFDDRTKDNVKKMINDIKIINYRIV